MTAGDDLTVLRAKYHDWCSARVADRFLSLSPDEIYSIAHGRAGGGGELVDVLDANASASSGSADASSLVELSYPELVERVTLALSRRMGLPDFEEWREAYRTDPARFDEEMMGFWRESAGD